MTWIFINLAWIFMYLMNIHDLIWIFMNLPYCLAIDITAKRCLMEGRALTFLVPLFFSMNVWQCVTGMNDFGHVCFYARGQRLIYIFTFWSVFFMKVFRKNVTGEMDDHVSKLFWTNMKKLPFDIFHSMWLYKNHVFFCCWCFYT